MKIRLIKDKSFYLSVLGIMLPVVAQSSINMGVNMMDTIMLGQLGEVQISASSLANSFYNNCNIFCMGLAGGTSVIASHYWGAKEEEKTKQVFSMAFQISAIMSIFFAVITWLFPGQIMRIYTPDPAVIEAGVRYLKITSFIYFFHGTGLVIALLMRTIGQQRLGLYVSIISFGVNCFSNWVFIFGHFGAPRMEIAGAALGTLISRVVEFIVTFYFVFKIDNKLCMKVKDFFAKTEKEVVNNYLKVGIPVLISDGLLGFGSTGLSMVLGRMGRDVVAANSICMVIDRLVTMVVTGVSQASGIVVGHTIGEGNKERAQMEGETFLILGIAFGLINAVLISVVGPLTERFYEITEETARITTEMIYAFSFIVFFQAIQSIMTKGVLRGGGDTKFLMKADILFLWITSIPLGVLVGLVLGWPAWITQIALRADYIIKSVWCISRLTSGKWIHDLSQKNRMKA